MTPEGTRRIELSLPGLYNVYNALGAATLARALGASLDEIAAGLGRFSAAFGRFERIPVGGKRLLLLLIKNSCRRERGRPHARRRRRAARSRSSR